MTQRGLLDRVTTTYLGTGVATPADAGATTLLVEWTVDFDDTGTLSLNDVQYAYTRPDDNETTLLLTTPLEAACEEGDVVYALDGNGQQQRNVDAYVQLDDGEEPLPFRLLSDVEGHITEDTPGGTGVVVDLRTRKILGLAATATDYTGQTTQVDPETGEQSSAVTEAGDAQVRALTITETAYTSPDRVDLGGYTLQDQFASQPAGRLRGLARPFDTPLSIGTDYVPLYGMDLPLTDDRSIDFGHEAMFDSASTSVPFQLDCFHTWSATEQPAAPTATGTPYYSLPSITAATANTPLLLEPGPGPFRPLSAGFHRFLWAAKSAGTVRAQGVHRVMFTDQGPAIFEDAGYWDDGAGGGESAAPQQYVETFYPTGTKWFNGDNTPRSDGPNQYFGQVSTQKAEGNRKSAIWFSHNDIRATLDGATVTKVELYLYQFSAAGGSSTVVIGSHNSTNNGQLWPNIQGKNPDLTRSANFPDGTSRWVTLSPSDGWNHALWKTTYGGVVIGPGPTTANLYAGGYKGVDSGSLVPKLRITFTR